MENVQIKPLVPQQDTAIAPQQTEAQTLATVLQQLMATNQPRTDISQATPAENQASSAIKKSSSETQEKAKGPVQLPDLVNLISGSGDAASQSKFDASKMMKMVKTVSTIAKFAGFL